MRRPKPRHSRRSIRRSLLLLAFLPLFASCDEFYPVVATLSFVAQPASMTAGSVSGSAIQVAVLDDADEVFSTAGSSVTIALGANPAGGVLSGTTTVSPVNGVATFSDLSIDRAGQGYTLIATYEDLSATSSATFAVMAGTATSIALHGGGNQNGVAGFPVATPPSVLVKDANDNPVGGAMVTFAVATGGGSVTGGTATSGANGIATVGSWTLGASVGANSLTATSSGLSGSPVTFDATGTAGAAARIAVNGGDNQEALVGSAVATAPSVIVRDVNDNPVMGVSVTFAVASGGGTIAGGSTSTDANGVATVGSWTLGAAAGVQSLSATAAGFLNSSVSFQATGRAGTPIEVALNAFDNQIATAGSAVAIPPSVIVRDAANNGVPGVSVTFAVASGGGSITGAVATTDANGIAKVGGWTLGTTMGSNALTATATGLTGSPVTINATGIAGPAAELSVSSRAHQVRPVGSSVTPPSVILKDANGNAIAGANVTFAVATGGGSITGASTTTNAGGIATVGSWTLGTTAGPNSLKATAATLAGVVTTFTADGAAGPATQWAIHAGNGQSATSGSAVAVAPSVIVRDVHNNGVPNVGVTFAVASGGGSVADAYPSTDANGVATLGSWTLGTTAGSNSLGVTTADPGIATGLTINANGTVGPPTQVAVNAGNNQTATVASAVAAAPSVVVRDVHNNVVANVSVTFAVASGGGSITGGIVATDANGIATVGSWTLGTTAGANSLSATFTGLAGSPAAIAATGTAGAVTQIAVNAAESQVGTAGAAVATQPSVILRDVYNNRVPGAGVNFAIATGGGATTGGSATTDANGIATVGSWTLGAALSTNTLTASPAGLPGSSVTFSAYIFTSVTAGSGHTCGLTSAGTAYCWGSNQSGRLGDGTETNRTTPTAVTGGLTFASLSASPAGSHTCGVTTTGAGYCWGAGSGVGALGNGSTAGSTVPVAVSGGFSFSRIAAGDEHTCGITTAGAAYCWGANNTGQLGDGSTTDTPVPVAVSGGGVYAEVTLGALSTCALTAAGQAFCWGFGTFGALGDGLGMDSSVPVLVSGGLVFTSLASGRANACGVAGGAAHCWGAGFEGGLGNGLTTDFNAPQLVLGGLVFASLGPAGGTHCAVSNSGAAYCWGRNYLGQIGDGSDTARSTPTAVSGGHVFTAVTGGSGHSCGLTTVGAIYCWGNNTAGRLGNGSTTASLVPVAVILPSN